MSGQNTATLSQVIAVLSPRQPVPAVDTDAASSVASGSLAAGSGEEPRHSTPAIGAMARSLAMESTWRAEEVVTHHELCRHHARTRTFAVSG